MITWKQKNNISSLVKKHSTLTQCSCINEVLKKNSSLQLIQDEILLKNEEKLRLKSRATWLEAGDRNAKFFHKFASFRGNLNSIWEISDENGDLTCS